jgi:hypothetical protein
MLLLQITDLSTHTSSSDNTSVIFTTAGDRMRQKVTRDRRRRERRKEREIPQAYASQPTARPAATFPQLPPELSAQLHLNHTTTMCILFHYTYRCHPSASETLFRPCYLQSLQTTEKAPFLGICPRLREKKIYSPNCVGCTETLSSCGMALSERSRERVWRVRG